MVFKVLLHQRRSLLLSCNHARFIVVQFYRRVEGIGRSTQKSSWGFTYGVIMMKAVSVWIEKALKIIFQEKCLEIRQLHFAYLFQTFVWQTEVPDWVIKNLKTIKQKRFTP